MRVRLAHREDGPANAPAVFLAPSLGTTWEMRTSSPCPRSTGWSASTPAVTVARCLAHTVPDLADSLGMSGSAWWASRWVGRSRRR